MNHEPTHLDLFSGIGGFALAAGWAGFRTIAFSEIDAYASAVLKKHWPDVPNLGDIRISSDWPDIGDVSLLTGGFPCQPHSLAGKRKGSADDRHLWPTMRDVIERYEPAWVCGENVPGIIGVEFDKVLLDLENLGYRVQSLVIPACAVDAPHRRDRVWIVAYGCGPAVANPVSAGLEIRGEQSARQECKTVKRGGAAVSHSKSNGRHQRRTESNPGRFADSLSDCKDRARLWPAEPDVGRVAHGIPKRVDRLKCLGNAIVPQVAYQILKAIRAMI